MEEQTHCAIQQLSHKANGGLRKTTGTGQAQMESCMKSQKRKTHLSSLCTVYFFFVYFFSLK